MAKIKLIVLDDDPTGSQTVHGCLLLTRWDPETLREALADNAPLFFVLTNTRGMSAERAAQLTRTVCRNIKQALADSAHAGHEIEPIVVSRSDSTLRGHYPIETDVIAQELGPFDAHFLIPAFIEGGRVTRDSVHYVMTEGRPVPVSETEFARDSVFAYTHAFLPDYVEEKTRGRIRADDVVRFDLADVRADCRERLCALEGNVACVVDAESHDDLTAFAVALQAATKLGKRFLCRGAAGIVGALAGLPPQPIPAEEMGRCRRNDHPGVVVVGSHVGKTTRQLARLLTEPDTAGIEVDVARLPDSAGTLLREVQARIVAAYADHATVVVYTSRLERRFSTETDRLAFGEVVSGFLVDVVQTLPADIGFLVSKGGITSNDVLSQGLALRTASVLGQILPGCSVVRCPGTHARYPGLPVVIVPGNVGDDDALVTILHRFSETLSAQTNT